MDNIYSKVEVPLLGDRLYYIYDSSDEHIVCVGVLGNGDYYNDEVPGSLCFVGSFRCNRG